MRRGPKPAKSKVEPKRRVTTKLPKEDARVRDLEKRLAESLERERAKDRALAESMAQQTATSEILRVIAGSPTDPQPVFDAILKRAATLCEAQLAHLWLYEGGEQFRLGAGYGSRPDHLEWLQQGLHRFRQPFFRESGPWRVGQVLDVRDTEPYRRGEPLWIRTADHEGMRTLLGVPLVKDGRLVGSIAVYRREVQPFTDQQTALVQTFADQAVIAIENVRLFTELQEKNRDLTEALEQQTATSDVLRVISQSQTDLQPVFDTLIDSAAKLCVADIGAITRFDGEFLRWVLPSGMSAEVRAFWQQNPIHPGRGSVTGRAALERRTMHVPDVLADSSYDYASAASPLRQGQAITGYRAALVAPMLRDGSLIGTIQMMRREARPFTASQIKLLETFADQAVIAIENVRLFTELEARNRELTTALDTQTATSDILRVISRSQTDVQPVFDTIVASATRLCSGLFSAVYRYDGELIYPVAYHNISPTALAAAERAFPMSPGRGGATARAVLTGEVVHIPDLRLDPEYAHQVLARDLGFPSILAVPMLREGVPIGAIAVAGAEAAPFSDKQIRLLQTFADQAVIAIENVRLFTELQASNRELMTALDTQTATSDILRVISRSQTDVQPVFDAILASAVRLLSADHGALTRVVGDEIDLAASTFTGHAEDAVVRAIRSGGVSHAEAIRTRAPINIADTETDPRVSEDRRALARARGYRSLVAVPLLRHDEALGAIAVTRREAGGFTADEIALLQTFADQAVIAIENARLLSELQARTRELTRSVDELTALGDVGRALSSTLDLETVLTTIVSQANQLAGTDGCSIFEYDEAAEEFQLRASRYADPRDAAVLDPIGRATPIPKGQGLAGRAALLREPVHIPDIAVTGAYESPVRQPLLEAGYRALLGVPLLREEQVIGVLNVTRKIPGDFSPEIVRLLMTFATQSALAIQNARLFREIEEKSHQLEVASQHKSEFLANMSHELRTPLNAIIGFSEVLSDRMFGELNEKQEEYLKDIYASGTHLLSLINDILDLSKIEAGRMELELTDFDLPTAIENALMLVRERAGRRSIALHTGIDNRLGQIQADERKVRQVVLNLLSNAIKFTPEGGRIEVSAVPRDGFVEVSVSDTGIGIAPEDQERVFEEFRQVGTAAKKVEGTGLGLTLCRKFVELHGGRIWVKSQVGEGSTFTFTIPVRYGE